MLALPPAVLAALVVVVGVVPVVGALIKVFGGPAVALMNAHVSEKTASTIRAIVDGVYVVGAAIAAATPTTLDDDVVVLVRQVDVQFAALHGRPMTDGEKSFATTTILAKHADPEQPNLSPGPITSSLSKGPQP